MRPPAPQALLFDLGGVLIDIDFGRALSAWAASSALPLAELQRRFRFDEQYERHERGEIGAHAYFDHLRATLQLTASHEEVARGWNAIFVGEISAARAAVAAARKSLPCFALTNTNAAHMACWSRRFPEVVGAFDRIFASHEMGLRKPERAVFEHICRATGVAPASFVFFDDLPDNVAAAARAGFQTVLVRSAGDVCSALDGLGLAT
jgi:putative hydrolase of the HAD superfamily